MPVWGWIVIAVAVVLVVVAVVTSQMMRKRRSSALRQRFGPEYDRTLERSDGRRNAERELAARAERRDSLDIRPLAPGARERYLAQWDRVQNRFVDDPQGAVAEADRLIQSVMADRGYPVDDFEQRAADVSVDHPRVVENYRAGHRFAERSALGDGTTEELRQAMRHHRALFDELLEEGADEPLARDRAADAGREGAEIPAGRD